MYKVIVEPGWNFDRG